MPYVNEIPVVCMNRACAFYHTPTFRSFDPTVDIFGNRVRCNTCGLFSGILVRETADFYRDIRIQDPYLDERGDPSGYNLLPTDNSTTYPIGRIPRFEMFPATLVRPAGVRPPVEILDPYRFPPPRAEDFGGMMDAFRVRPPAPPAPTAD